MTIGDLIKQRRTALHYSLEYVGQIVGVDRATVSRWENGQIGKMGRDKISALSRLLMIDPVLFVQPHELLFPEEREILDAYRSADPGTQAAVRKLLDIPEKNDSSASAI